jgi:hypothetical protein
MFFIRTVAISYNLFIQLFRELRYADFPKQLKSRLNIRAF